MVLVKDYEFNKDGKIPGCRVNQLFYKYTLEEYPTLEEKIEDVIIKPEDDEDTLEPSTNKVDGIPYNKTMIDNPDYQ
jgi:hypothetical protein